MHYNFFRLPVSTNRTSLYIFHYEFIFYTIFFPLVNGIFIHILNLSFVVLSIYFSSGFLCCIIVLVGILGIERLV